MQKRRAAARREHVVSAGFERRAALVRAQDGGQLGEKRDRAQRGRGLRWHAAGWQAAPSARELVADMNDAGGEVDFVPTQREHLGEAHAGVEAGCEERPVAAWTGGEEANELGTGESSLLGAQRTRPLVTLEPPKRVRADIPTTERIREDTTERAKNPLTVQGARPVACSSRATAATSSGPSNAMR
jgi:hypothetical protein